MSGGAGCRAASSSCNRSGAGAVNAASSSHGGSPGRNCSSCGSRARCPIAATVPYFRTAGYGRA